MCLKLVRKSFILLVPAFCRPLCTWASCWRCLTAKNRTHFYFWPLWLNFAFWAQSLGHFFRNRLGWDYHKVFWRQAAGTLWKCPKSLRTEAPAVRSFSSPLRGRLKRTASFLWVLPPGGDNNTFETLDLSVKWYPFITTRYWPKGLLPPDREQSGEGSLCGWSPV